jgi:hypothetical protein
VPRRGVTRRTRRHERRAHLGVRAPSRRPRPHGPRWGALRGSLKSVPRHVESLPSPFARAVWCSAVRRLPPRRTLLPRPWRRTSTFKPAPCFEATLPSHPCPLKPLSGAGVPSRCFFSSPAQKRRRHRRGRLKTRRGATSSSIPSATQSTSAPTLSCTAARRPPTTTAGGPLAEFCQPRRPAPLAAGASPSTGHPLPQATHKLNPKEP